MMDDPIRIAVAALEKKAAELLEERMRIRRRLLEDSVRDLQIDRDVAGCSAGAKALGWELDLPESPAIAPAKRPHHTNFLNARNGVASFYQQFKEEYGLEADVDDDGSDDPRPELPRIADVILERLENAGAGGSKAASIRRYILDTYDADIHEKTVGMTLNRLQKDGLVRRDGHTWFLAPSGAENPGGSAPGPDED